MCLTTIDQIGTALYLAPLGGKGCWAVADQMRVEQTGCACARGGAELTSGVDQTAPDSTRTDPPPQAQK
ncbi:MAG: hypothetical protein RL685_1563 [Pseudomonadota bacterium]|jgi:hypothetical protein